MSRVRKSIHKLEEDYNNGKKAELENLIRAFRGIQKLDPSHPNSFFRIASYHGQPFRGPGVTDDHWWGGYCNHRNVLFPTWHRAHLWRLEEALRSIPGCEDVTLPYWDELLDEETPLPKILTSPNFPFDQVDEPNPLYSYKLQQKINYNLTGGKQRFSKHLGYETVRIPHCGLVGTEKERKKSEARNALFTNAKTNAALLNENVKSTLDRVPHGVRGFPEIPVRQWFQHCLEAPNYTVFSNSNSREEWLKSSGEGNKRWAVSLESPHDAIHVALGMPPKEDADKSDKAHGDMGFNETAAFDPIFYLHHCFIDYAFWLWQKKHKQTTKLVLGEKEVKDYPGTFVGQLGLPYLPPGTKLTMATPLYPFRRLDQTYMTSDDVTDITAMGYVYEKGSLDLLDEHRSSIPLVLEKMVGYKYIFDISRKDVPGSFIIRTTLDIGKERIEIWREPVLSRLDVSDCANCQNKLEVGSFVPIFEGMIDAIASRNPKEDVMLGVDIQTFDRTLAFPKHQFVRRSTVEKDYPRAQVEELKELEGAGEAFKYMPNTRGILVPLAGKFTGDVDRFKVVDNGFELFSDLGKEWNGPKIRDISF